MNSIDEEEQYLKNRLNLIQQYKTNSVKSDNSIEGINDYSNQLIATMTQKPGLLGELFDKKSDTIKSFFIGFAGGLGFFIALKVYNSISKKKEEHENEITFE